MPEAHVCKQTVQRDKGTPPPASPETLLKRGLNGIIIKDAAQILIGKVPTYSPCYWIECILHP